MYSNGTNNADNFLVTCRNSGEWRRNKDIQHTDMGNNWNIRSMDSRDCDSGSAESDDQRRRFIIIYACTEESDETEVRNVEIGAVADIHGGDGRDKFLRTQGAAREFFRELLCRESATWRLCAGDDDSGDLQFGIEFCRRPGYGI